MIRQRGWALVGVGSLLLALMTAIIVSMALVIARSGDPGAATRFDGSPAMATTIFAVLGLVWLFGLTSLENGIWLLRYRKRNQLLVKITIGLFFAVFVAGWLIQMIDD